MAKPRVLLGDDEPIVLAGLKQLLNPDFDVIGAECDGRALVHAAAVLCPAVVVLEISLPGLSGIKAAETIRANNSSVQVVIFTIHSEDLFKREAVRAGACAYISKQSSPEELLAAVRSAAGLRRGEEPMTEPPAPRDEPSALASLLTSRQREVLQFVAEGRTLKEIAAVLDISSKTVEFHKYRLMALLGARTTAELTTIAIRHGLISLRRNA